MIFKFIPLLSGSIGLVTCCTIDDVGILLLVPIPQIQNLGVHIWNQGKWFGRHITQVDNFVHESELTPYYLESVLPWTLE
jgi:hypothetical protein